ncbi:MAG: hypothetical protein NTZ78_02640 [Candidatus Aureabacteria bacterium]|nr:hypothetical protein [Candidatus Auribacterota bacterium]
MFIDFISSAGKIKTFIIIAVAFLASSLADAVPAHSAFSQCSNHPFSPELSRDSGLRQSSNAISKIGRIAEGCNLIWGESIGWINLRTTHADLKIGSNILSGWIWLENCGWICLGEGHPLEGGSYTNLGSYDWGVNNDGRGNLSGYAWSEVTGWISFRTDHSRVYLDERGQFYGYAWGENVGWMHFGPGGRVSYLAKADPGPWREFWNESRSRLAGGPDNSEMSSGSVPVAGLRSSHERYNTDAWAVCLLRLGRDDFSAHIRCCDTPVYISSLATLSSIRAPPAIV